MQSNHRPAALPKSGTSAINGRRWAGLPFVFAMWVARDDRDLRGVEQALGEARDAGVAHLTEIAEREAAGKGLTVPQCLVYLRDNLHFYFGPQEQEGLAKFYRHAADLRLAPEGVNLGFESCTSAR